MAGGQKIEQLVKKIQASLPEISKVAAEAEIVANKQVEGLILDRIFTLGKKADGTPIGAYKNEQYKKKRIEEGLQTSYIDAQFTGRLFNSITTGNLNGKPAVGITDPNRAEVSQHLDEKYGVIFTASVSERAEAINVARDYAFKRIREIVKGWS